LNYILSITVIAIFIGCAPKTTEIKEDVVVEKEIIIEHSSVAEIIPVIKTDDNPVMQDGEIYDLKNIPQDVEYYTKSIRSLPVLYKKQKEYEKNYFKVWNIDKHEDSLRVSKWAFAIHKTSNSFGGNFQPIKQSFFDDMYKKANFEEYGTKNLKAITIKEIDIRAFPTIKPLYRDPSIAGEGYPFDYLQNSTIHANKPIFISHYSLDKEWAFVFSSFTSGWVKSNDLVILDSKYTDIWQQAQQVSIIKEGIAIYDTNNNFLFNSKIGMMFALIEEDSKSFTVLSVSSYKNSKPLFLKSKISKKIANKGPLKFTKRNISDIIKEVSKTYYGWGGLNGQRDCSSMLRDFYAPFGIWLPRNSSKQSKIGKSTDLEKFTPKEKETFIKEKAVAFKTLIYKKGHIMLYVGTYKGEPIVFHNIWGIKTRENDIEGRLVVAKPIYSTLKIGQYQKNYDSDAMLLKRVKSLNIVTR